MASVELYCTAVCAYCVAAKNLLKLKGFDYEEIRIDRDPVLREQMLSRTGGVRSVPQIFVNGVHIGGFEELVAADRSGKLAEIALGSGA